VSEQNTGDFTWGSSPQGVTHLQLPSTPDALPHIRALVVEAAEKLGLGAEDVAKVEMAVVENFPDRLEVTVLDYSTINFPVDAMPGVTIDEYLDTQRHRGLGLHIIRTFVDHIEHRFICRQGNQLRLVKYLA